MKLHSYHDLTTKIVNLSARDGKPIKITWSGDFEAHTMFNEMTLPTLPAGTVLTRSQFDIYFGAAIHESWGHQVHTDFNVYKQFGEKHNNPTYSYLQNILEDIYCENADLKNYPGDRRTLNATHQYVDDLAPLEKCKNPDILGQIYKHLYVNFRNLDTRRIEGTLTNKQIENLLSTRVPNCHSTLDCSLLAEELLPLVQAEHQNPSQQNKSNNPNSNGDQNESENGQANGDNGNLQPSSSTENQNSREGQSLSDPNSQSDQQQNNNSSNSNNPDPNNEGQPSNSNSNSNPNGTEGSNSKTLDQLAQEWHEITEVKRLIQKLTKEINETNNIGTPASGNGISNQNGKSIFPPLDISLDRIFIPSSENMNQYLQTRTSLAPQITALKKMFRIHLQSKSNKNWLRGLDEGSTLDTQRLYITASGATTIFKEKTTKTLTNTAISLMLDMSQSMNIKTARAATIIIAEALSTIPQIKLSINGFSTNGRYAPKTHENIGRAVGMDILQFKDFSEPYIKCRAKLGAINRIQYTPLGDAYGKSLEQLIPRPEPRKIIFLITDGKPEFTRGRNHSDYLLMDQINNKAKKLNIETLGIGIGNTMEFLDKYVQKFVKIDKIETLPQDLLTVLKAVIH